ncbi:hypothetical protein GJ496_004568 [Pomphorhynchus laevis]|nr:hypothetical protein GJ496_004568 [Pomphorhynchus laevis]
MDVVLWKGGVRFAGVLLPPFAPNIIAGSLHNQIYDCLVCREFYNDQDLIDIGFRSNRICKIIEDTRLNLLRDLAARF